MYSENVILKSNPAKNLAPQKYKRQRSNEDSSNSSWDSMSSPIQSSIVNPMAFANALKAYQTPQTPKFSSFNNFMTSTPSMATLAAAAAAAEPSINFTISFFKSLNAVSSPFTDHVIDASKIYCVPPTKVESMEMKPSPYDTNISDDVQPSIRLSVDSIVSGIMYDSERYMELKNAEEINLQQFIKMHLEHFPLKRTYSQEKVRSVCRKNDYEQASGIDAAAEKLRKAKYRQLNNENSQRSRYKQKMARIESALTAIFYRDRIASYERRIEKMIDTVMHPNETK